MNKLYLLLFIPLLMFNCKTEEEDILAPNNLVTEEPESEEVETIVPTGNEQYLNKDSDYIFDQNKLHTFELNLPVDALAKLDNDPAAEEYVEGSLTFEGETISPVGIRYKGSIGAYVGCVSGTDWTNPSGHKTCTKLSMKVKINWEDREEKFFKLKKLQLHSQNHDESQMRDRLGYWIFRQMGVPAPRAVHARLLVNGKYVGLFALVEQVDGRFTRYNYEDGTGNLYKEIWPLAMSGSPFSEQAYLNHLETNTDENPTAIMMRTFAQEIADADDSNIKDVIAKWMDVNEVLSYAVVDRTIRHDDGPFHWYCNGGDCTSHNFYWYEEPTTQKMHLIPWDLDNAFENIIANANPVTPIADSWGEISGNCQPFSYGFWGLQQWSAACDKLTNGWVKYEDEYNQLKEELIAGPISEAQVDAQLVTWANQIRAATKDASDAHSDAVTIAEWENAMSQLKAQLEYAREH